MIVDAVADLAPFKALIKERCGLFFEDHGEQKLATALQERAQTKKIANVVDYYTRLRGDEREFQDLVNLLTINETYFFREADQIRLMTDRLVPRLLAQRKDASPLRILSAGCSSGEEPYSLAMALKEKYGGSVSQLFSFVGADIDSAVLEKARSAQYSEFSFRGVPDQIRARYFEKKGWSYVLHDSIRRLVTFQELNLLATGFSPALQGFDIIFFRNVSIYFDTPTRRTIQENLSTLMKESGFLVIGTSETLANDLGVLPLVDEDSLFYFVKGKPPLAAKVTASSRVFAAEPPARPDVVAPPQIPMAALDRRLDVTPVVGVQPNLEQASQFTREKRFDQALLLIEVLLATNSQDIQAWLLKAHILLNRKDFIAADQVAQKVLTLAPWSADALLLLGLAAKWGEQPVVAIKWFKQAIYGCHECWPAHYYLADIYRKSGDLEQARRAYRVVLQLLADGKQPDTGIKVIPLGLPTAEVRFLCEHQLGKLAEPKLVAKISTPTRSR